MINLYEILLVIMGATELVLTIALFALQRRQTVADQQIAEIKALGERVNDQRLDEIVSDISELKDRLKDGDDAFDKLNESDHSLELEHVNAINSLSQWVQRNTIGKDDFQRHQDSDESRLRGISDELTKIHSSVASIGTALGLKAGKHTHG